MEFRAKLKIGVETTSGAETLLKVLQNRIVRLRVQSLAMATSSEAVAI